MVRLGCLAIGLVQRLLVSITRHKVFSSVKLSKAGLGRSRLMSKNDERRGSP
jgi:hypothetical protein